MTFTGNIEVFGSSLSMTVVRLSVAEDDTVVIGVGVVVSSEVGELGNTVLESLSVLFVFSVNSSVLSSLGHCVVALSSKPEVDSTVSIDMVGSDIGTVVDVVEVVSVLPIDVASLVLGL